jgi:hypothetical protein
MAFVVFFFLLTKDFGVGAMNWFVLLKDQSMEKKNKGPTTKTSRSINFLVIISQLDPS